MKIYNLAAAMFGLALTLIGTAVAQLPPAEVAFLGRNSDLANTAYGREMASGKSNNPARLQQYVKDSQVGVKAARVENSAGPDLRFNYLQASQRLSSKLVVQLTGQELHGDGLVGPALVRYRERNLGGQIAYQLTPKLTLGAGTAYLATRTTFTVAPLGNFEVVSHPRGIGGIVGGLYKVDPRVAIQATYRVYGDRVRIRPNGVFAPLGDSTVNFKTNAMEIGVDWTSRYGQVNLSVSKARISRDGGTPLVKEVWLNGGIDVPIHPQIALQAGFNDRHGSVGATVQVGKNTTFQLARTGRNKPTDRGTRSYTTLELTHNF